MKQFLYKFIIPPLGFVLTYLISLTLRIKTINQECENDFITQKKNRIYTFWHGRLFIFPFLYRWQRDKAILVSPSIDGEIIARLLALFGFLIIRGSSYKSGRKAFWNLSRCLHQGNSAVLIGDGSRGPRYKIQKGVIYLAKITQKPIIPMVYAAHRQKIFQTWDEFILPCPFSRAIVIYGKPVLVRKDDSLQTKSDELQEEMTRIKKQADSYFSG